MLLLFSGIYRIRARIPVVGSAKNPVWKKTASCFVYIYTTNLTLCVYTVHIQYKNTTWLLFIAHCFVKGLHLFLILWYFLAHQYIGETTATTIKNFDGPTGLKLCRGILFFGDLRVEFKGLCVQIYFGSDPTDDKHNYVSFAFQIISLCLPFSPNPSNMSLFSIQ